MRLLWDFQCLLGSFQFTRPRGRCFHLLVGTIRYCWQCLEGLSFIHSLVQGDCRLFW